MFPFGFLAICLLVITAPLSADAAGPCLRYEVPVTLKGVYATAVFPGVRNYNSVKGGDEPEPVTFLMLDTPICIDAAGDPISADIPSIAALQVSRCGVKTTPGEYVTLHGALFASFSGHHHSAALLDCG
jgi:hypothetical protein